MADKDNLDLSDEIDRLLRHELSIEPSPAFAARVRERLGEEVQRHHSWWRARWIPAIGSFATVASIAWALLLPAVTRVVSPPEPPSAPAASQIALHHPQLDPWTFSVPITATGRIAPPRIPTQGVVETDLPVVIVDRRDRLALDRFVTLVQQGRLGQDAFAHTSQPAVVAIEDTLSPIVVTPVAVSSIPAGGVLRSETERK